MQKRTAWKNDTARLYWILHCVQDDEATKKKLTTNYYYLIPQSAEGTTSYLKTSYELHRKRRKKW